MATQPPVLCSPGNSPLILCFPHTGTAVAPAFKSKLSAEGKKLRDTDWHVDRLYQGVFPGATTVQATFHRYVIDANRDPSGTSLYPGQNTTSLVPQTDFDNQPLWQLGVAITQSDIEERLRLFHAPYHAQVKRQIDRIHKLHGIAVVFDCHSIRSECPFLFDGVLPDLNLGTFDGRSCAPQFEESITAAMVRADGYSHVVNGRFKGGWTTRHYGQPDRGVHAIQLELAQSTHLATESLPFAFDYDKARTLRVVLSDILRAVESVALNLKSNR
jgi:N-formylglutamate deformylase